MMESPKSFPVRVAFFLKAVLVDVPSADLILVDHPGDAIPIRDHSSNLHEKLRWGIAGLLSILSETPGTRGDLSKAWMKSAPRRGRFAIGPTHQSSGLDAQPCGRKQFPGRATQ
jgi:hypothetical protein